MQLKKSLDGFRNLFIILGHLWYTFIHIMGLRLMPVSGQLTYIKNQMVTCYFYGSYQAETWRYHGKMKQKAF